MKSKYKISLYFLFCGVFVTLLLHSNEYKVGAQIKDDKSRIYKELQVTKHLPTMPENYEFINWREVANRYNNLIFDSKTYGITYIDRSYFNTPGEGFGILSYIGDEPNILNSQAMNAMAALISANLINPNSVNTAELQQFVSMINTYYNVSNGEGMILNYPNAESKQLSFWAEIYPCILYFMLMDRYEATVDSDEILKTMADRWHEVVMQLGGRDGQVDFAYTGYDFKNNMPFDNGLWIEPDAAAGVALIEYFAYAKFKDPKYYKATRLCMDYMENFQQNPGYEILYLYLPYLAARLNAVERGRYDTTKYLDWAFNLSDSRQNYGMSTKEFGIGLIGDNNLYGGSLQSLPSVIAPTALVPMLKYDQRYAKEIGRYLLYLTNNLKMFYPNYLEPNNQSDYETSNVYDDLIPYERVNKKGPNNSGPYGDGQRQETTNLSVLSGSFLGMLGAMIEETDVEGILKVNLNTNDYYVTEETNYPMYLIYNPYDEEKVIHYKTQTLGNVSLYDTIGQDFIAKHVSGQIDIPIKANEARIVMEIPIKDSVYGYERQMKREVEKNIAAKNYFGVNFVGLFEYDPISNDKVIELDLQTSDDAAITSIEIFIDRKSVFKNVTYAQPYKIEIDKLVNGYHIISAEVKDNHGHVDRAYARIFIQKDENPYVINGLPHELMKWHSYDGGTVSYGNGESSVIIKGSGDAQSGIISDPFMLDLGQMPLLALNVTDYNAPWSIFMINQDTDEKFYILENSEMAGSLFLNLNYELFKLNTEQFHLKGEHNVQLGIEVSGEAGTIETTMLRVINEGIQPLKPREWKSALTTKKMIHWQARPNSLGKINYYDGLAEIKNLNRMGSGGIVTGYFEVDLKRNPTLTIKVKDVDNLWSVLMYIEGEKQGYYMQYPTDAIGTFSYPVQDILDKTQLSAEELGEKNIQFWIVTDGDYGAVTKVDYIKIAYEKSWWELAVIGTIMVLSTTAIFVNLHKES